MNALVTGATGFLGLHLSRALKMRGDTIIGLVHDAHADTPFEYFDHWAAGDVLDHPMIERILCEYEIGLVFHLAAQVQTSVAFANPLHTLQTNVMGTANILEACRRMKTPRVIVASTDKAYGEHTQRCSESFALEGRGPYEASKSCMDTIAQSYAFMYGMSVGITRCANLYGPGHTNLSTLIPGTIRRILRGERPRLYNGGNAVREFLYIDDAVEGYLALAHSDYIGPVNFGGRETFLAKDVVKMILQDLASDLEPENVESRGNEIKCQRLDTSLAERVLGWQPGVTFAEGLHRTIAWHRELVECAL